MVYFKMDKQYLEQVKERMLLDYKSRTDPSWLAERTFFLTIHGSQAYGLARSESDFDIGGICIPPKKYFHGFLHNFEQAQSTNPDGAIYGIKKFMKLASDANPNVMELLWINPEFWIITHSFHKLLVENRELFLSTKVKHTYSGYATAQLNRIKTHRKWLVDPPDHRPTREEFGLPSVRLLSADQMGALNELVNQDMLKLDDNLMKRLQKENEFKRAVQEYKQYENWKITRNLFRSELEKLHGYDTKHAMHLVRLMTQCREILTTGKLNVFRADRDFLLDIRNGMLTCDEIIKWSEDQDKELDALAAISSLPHDPDRNKIDTLCQQIVEIGIVN